MQLPFGIQDLLSHPAVQQALASSVPQAQAPEESPITAEAPIQRKGMFGIHGTARDILGVLGDAFLTQAGRNTVYEPQRDREQIAQALGGSEDFISNPLAAIKKLNDAGYPEQAQELYKQYATLQISQNSKGAQAALDQARLENERSRGYGILGAMADPRSLNEKTFDAMVPIMVAKAQRSGIDIPPPPKDWASGGQAWADQIRRMGIDPYKAERLGQIDTGLDIQQQNANTNARWAPVRAKTGVANAATAYYRAVRGDAHQDVTEDQGNPNSPNFNRGRKGGKSFGGPSAGIPSDIPPPRHPGDTAVVNGIRIKESGGKWVKAQ